MFIWVSWLWKEGQPFSVDEEDRVTFLDSTSMVLNYLLQQNTEHAMWCDRFVGVFWSLTLLHLPVISTKANEKSEVLGIVNHPFLDVAHVIFTRL